MFLLKLKAITVQRFDRAFADGCAKLSGQSLCNVFSSRVINDFWCINDFPSDKIKPPELIGQAHLDRLLACPVEATERLFGFLQTFAATRTHHTDELLVNLIKHALDMCLLLR